MIVIAFESLPSKLWPAEGAPSASKLALDFFGALPTRTTCGRAWVAALALLRKVLPTLKAGLGGPEAYLFQSTLGTGGVISPELAPFDFTLTTAAFPLMTVCAGTGDTIAFLPYIVDATLVRAYEVRSLIPE